MKKYTFTFLMTLLMCFNLSYAQTLISEGKTATASSFQDPFTVAGANDGNPGTRWASQWNADEWWQVDLETSYQISSVVIAWEGAYATAYEIQLSDDPTFATYDVIATVTGGDGGEDIVTTNTSVSGRYLRFQGVTRALQLYGYSFWELEVYDHDGGSPTSYNVNFSIPYAQYLRLGFNPVTANGDDQLIVQNKTLDTTLVFNNLSSLTISLLEKRRNDSISFYYVDQLGDTVRGMPLTIPVYDNLNFGVEWFEIINNSNQPPVADAGNNSTILSPASSVVLDGSASIDPDGVITAYSWSQVNGPSTATFSETNLDIVTVSDLQLGTYTFQLEVTDDSLATATDNVIISVLQPTVYDFYMITPTDSSMVTDTRTPEFTWQAYTGAVNYEVFVNVSRDDYDWYASGNLLDRYTKVGETTGTSFTMPYDLVDRWTYKVYVIATTGGGEAKTSNVHQFGLYIPYLEQEADGINIVNGCRDMNKNGTIEPYEDWHLTPKERVDDLMARMTLAEKGAQSFYGGVNNALDGFAFSYGVEGGMRTNQLSASGTRLGIPMAFMGDKIHGWKTIYPTQLGLAAARDMDLVYQCGNLQRIEQKAFGFTGSLSPLAEVNTKVLYPRFQEGCGENATEAAANVRAMVCGMQGGPEINPHSMLVTVKHWPSQGAGGESFLQYDENTIGYHMKPWHAVVEVNAASVMPGYNTAPFLDPNNGANSSKPVIDYLRDEMNFKGFVVTDWLASNTAQSQESMGAGIDVMGGANSVDTDMNALVADIGMDRLNEACRRVLDMKIRLGMFENPFGDPTATYTLADHHDIVVNAAKKTFTLLKNENAVLPLNLSAGDKIVVDGPRATWTNQDNDPNVIWQSIYYADNQALTYYNAIQQRATGITVSLGDANGADVAVVVIGEEGYTHGTDWADKNPHIPADQVSIIQNLYNQGIPVVCAIISPRPYILSEIEPMCDAMVLMYRAGTGAGQALAQLIFGDYEPSGKLPFQLPKDISQIGADNVNTQGTSAFVEGQVEQWEIPYDIGATKEERELIYWYMSNDLEVPTNFGDPLYPYGYGLQGFANNDATNPTAFSLVSPADNSIVQLGQITLNWEMSSDPESNIKYYEVWLDGQLYDLANGNFYTLPASIATGIHDWYVVAVNWADGKTQSNETYSFNLTDTDGPVAFGYIEPLNNSQILGTSASLKWQSTIDLGVGLDRYDVYVDGAIHTTILPGQNESATTNMALGKTTTATSVENGGTTANLAVDGNLGTRWSSAPNNNESITVDLASPVIIGNIHINWEAAYASSYEIEFSQDGSTWETVVTETAGSAGWKYHEDINQSAQYVRIQGISRATQYGYSIYELEIYDVAGIIVDVTGLSYGSHNWEVLAVDSLENTTSGGNWFFTLYNDGTNLPPVPVLEASYHTTQNSITIDASGSYDPESQAINYLWTQIDGPNTATISDNTSSTPLISNLIQGVYTFGLAIDDGVNTVNTQTEVYADPLITGMETVNASLFKVYPNPANDYINIQSNSQTIDKIMILDLLGNQIGVYQPESDITSIDCSKLSAGMYIIVAVSEKQQQTKLIQISK